MKRATTACDKCAPDFYLVNGACEAVTSLIAGCQYYSPAKTCVQCKTDFFHNADGSCTQAFTAAHCSEVISTAGQCALCEPGYAPTATTQCSLVQPKVNGCLFNDQSTPSKCLVCNFGFYQATQGGPCLASNLP